MAPDRKLIKLRSDDQDVEMMRDQILEVEFKTLPATNAVVSRKASR